MSGRVTYNRAWRGLKTHLETAPKRAQEEGQRISNECAQLGQEIMQGMVDRVDTTLMKSEVKYKPAKTQRNVAKYGWVERVEDYFYYQDRGFDHVGGGRVEGMFALFRSFMIVREEFRKRVKEMGR